MTRLVVVIDDDGTLRHVLTAALAALDAAAPTAAVVTPDFRLDLDDRSATRTDGRPCRLTATEWSIVELLVTNAERLVTSQRLLDHLRRSPEHEPASSLVRVHLTHIRRKLEPDPARPRYFVNEPRLGYRFTNRPDPALSSCRG